MSQTHERNIPLFLLCLAGLLVSVAAGVSEHLPPLKFLCAAACRETAEITLLLVPLWLWGALFWAAAAVLAWSRSGWMPWIAAPAAGMEAALVWVMFLMGAPCLFCIANAVGVLVLVVVSFRKELAWQQSTLALLFLLACAYWIPHENRLPVLAGPRSGGAPGSDIVARVGDEAITDSRLEVLVGPKLLELRKDVYRLKREKLDQLVVELIIQKAAKEKGQTIEQFLDEAVPASNMVATEQEVDKYLQDNHERTKDWPGAREELRARVKTFLEQQRRALAVTAYARTLDQQFGVQVYLSPPRPPNVKVDITGAPVQGPGDAPVTIIEFSDYECPACRSTHLTVKRLKEIYGNRIRWIFRDYPLRQHKSAFKAAEAAHCAADSGKFWEYQDVVFTSDKLDPESLVKYAAELGLPSDSFRRCLDEGKHKATVENSLRAATQSGVDRTPSFIINGALLTGGPAFEVFKTKIDEELQKETRKR
ncbi:MAG: thioredoxin domain-containing protein [Syntrophobacteraceae bacterium]